MGSKGCLEGYVRSNETIQVKELKIRKCPICGRLFRTSDDFRFCPKCHTDSMDAKWFEFFDSKIDVTAGKIVYGEPIPGSRVLMRRMGPFIEERLAESVKSKKTVKHVFNSKTRGIESIYSPASPTLEKLRTDKEDAFDYAIIGFEGLEDAKTGEPIPCIRENKLKLIKVPVFYRFFVHCQQNFDDPEFKEKQDSPKNFGWFGGVTARFDLSKSNKICQSLLKMKFDPDGRGPERIDCTGVVVLYMREFGISIPDSTTLEDWEKYDDESGNVLSKLFKKVGFEEKFEMGDVLVFRSRRNPIRDVHQGIYLSEGDFIHAFFDIDSILLVHLQPGVVIDNLNDHGGLWKLRLYSRFRLRE